MSEHKHKLCGSKIAWLFLFTGMLFFATNSAIHGISIYKQYKQLKLMQDMQSAIKMQMEFYERQAPIDPDKVL